MDSTVSIHECGICNEDYNSCDHKPLFLECGHTSCLSCMIQMEKPNGINCPRCRKFTPKQVFELPVNFDLIPVGDQSSLDATRTMSVTRCGNHGLDLGYLCANCGDLVCQTCKRDFHTGHKVASLQKIAGSASAVDARVEFRLKLQAKLNGLRSSLTAPREMLQMIEEIKTDVEEWRDSLLNSVSYVEKDLQLWDSLGSCPDQEDAVKDVVLRTKKAEVSQEYKQFQIGTKLEEMSKKYFVNKEPSVNAAELPHRGTWRITTEEVAASAILSVKIGRSPQTAVVTSWPTNPLQQIPQLLDVLGGASKNIDLRLMDFFWRSSSKRDLRLEAFIRKYGHNVGVFLGSLEDALAVCEARGEGSLVLGVRLADMDDVESCTALTTAPRSVCCIRGLPTKAGARIKELKWKPQRWHFPDVRDDDLDWIHSLVKRILPHVQASTVILPRCRLTEKGFGTLLKRYEGQVSFISCGAISLTGAAQARLVQIARKKDIDLRWKQY